VHELILVVGEKKKYIMFNFINIHPKTSSPILNTSACSHLFHCPLVAIRNRIILCQQMGKKIDHILCRAAALATLLHVPASSARFQPIFSLAVMQRDGWAQKFPC
jgi:hypothetical protein